MFHSFFVVVRHEDTQTLLDIVDLSATPPRNLTHVVSFKDLNQKLGEMRVRRSWKGLVEEDIKDRIM